MIMKRWAFLAVVILASATLISGCGKDKNPLETEGHFLRSALMTSISAGDPEYGESVDLVAARTEDVGSVHCWISGDSLHILYSADGNWTLTETHMVVSETLEDIPTTKNGNPKVGHFPFKNEHNPPVSEFRYSLELDAWGFEDAEELFIATHADVSLLTEGGSVEREEGAWGNGERFCGTVPRDPKIRESYDYEAAERKQEIAERASNDCGNWAMYFKVNVNKITAKELMINEIFYCGSDRSSFYFYDQFVELYNSSDDTLYLDGIILTRQTQTYYPDQEEVDFVRAIYAFQFPGTPVTGKQYPIRPKQYVVIASDAVDHTLYCSKSIDLSGADWECFNPIGSDYDNPTVPNIVSIHPTSRMDYLINLSHNAAVISTGEEYSFWEYEPGRFHVIIPIYTIIDGIEYASNSTLTKVLTQRVDAGFAGLGCTKYSGHSTERRELGLDTDNSSFDFLLITPPTPGYSHIEEALDQRPHTRLIWRQQ